MVYIAFIESIVRENEVSLIEKLLEFEGQHYYKWSSKNPDEFKYIKKYYKGGRPAIVFRRDFIDVPTNSPDQIVYGFWGLVEYLRNKGLIRC
jgi:hypothetical protein